MTIKRLNPDTMYHNPAFTQVATVSAGSTLVFVGGQNGVNKKGELAGTDIASQSVQAFKNVLAALEAAGASMKDVFKMTIFLVQGQSYQEAFEAVIPLQDKDAKPATVTGVIVAGLAMPGALIEIEAVAAISEKKS